MKIKGFLAVAVAVVCLLTFIGLKSDEKTPEIEPQVVSNVTLNLSDSDSTKVLSSRFLNMLNHNFVYGEDFLSADTILNLSIIAQRDKADENGEFIEENIVTSFVFDMYGIEIIDTTEFSAGYPQKEGHLYLVPQGFTVYKHQNAEITENEDGTYTVTTQVSVDGHDGEDEVLYAKSLFAKNSKSALGFNIIYSEICETSNNSLQV